MGEVIQFPTDIKPQNIEFRLKVMVDVLDEIGEHLHKSYQQVKEMENQYKHVQDQYDSLLLDYANDVGHENVAVGLLEYSTKVEADVDVDVKDEVSVDAEGDDIEISKRAVKAKVEVGLSPEEEIVQDSLKAAMDAAEAIGSETLADQIGNTITYFTRQFVVGNNSD